MNASQLNLQALPMLDILGALSAVVPSIWSHISNWSITTNIGEWKFRYYPDSTRTPEEFERITSLAREKPFLICSKIEVKAEKLGFDTMGGLAEDREELIRYESSNGVTATMEIKAPGVQRALQIVGELEKQFTFLSPRDLTKQIASPNPELVPVLLREAAVSDLHAQLARLGEFLSSITEKDVELRKQRMAELDAEHKARMEELERERKKALEEVAKQEKLQLVELQAREAALEQKIGEFETREAKFVRRDLLAKLNELLDQFGTFKLSEGTTRKRRPVTVAALVMAALFVAVTAVAGYDYLTTLDWHYLPASSAGLIGFSATMLFYLKWSDRWFREHADEELQSKRYKADMLRASWIAELAAEWAMEGKQAPPELLDVFARNLFSNAPDLGVTEHPVDALLGLMRRAQKVDVGKDRITVESGSSK